MESLSGRLPESLAWNDRSLQLARAAGDRSRESSVLQNRAAVLARCVDWTGSYATAFHSLAALVAALGVSALLVPLPEQTASAG